jgi:C4-dicarboxylate-specific signal transduction histidine kinase
MFLIVIIIGGLLSLSFGSRLVKNTLIDQAQAKVKHDLAAAWMVFNEKLNDIKEIVRLTAAREGIKGATKNNNKDILFRYLSRVREEYGLDVLTLTDSTGIVIVRTRNPDVIGDDQSHLRLLLEKNSLKKEKIWQIRLTWNLSTLPRQLHDLKTKRQTE